MVAVVLLLILFIASLALLLFNGNLAKRIALAVSFIELAFTAHAWQHLSNGDVAELTFNIPWVNSFGINFHIAIDGISMVLILLTNILMPLILLSSFKHEYKNHFYSLVLFMQMALVGVFMAADGFLFYVFWELALIPIYFICLLWGGEDRARITFKFFVYTLTGSLFMLVALIFLYQHTGAQHSFDINALYEAGRGLNLKAQSFVFWCMFLAFAIKIPIFPFHTWQPDTYITAPTSGTMLLSGIMLKMGLFGLIRWLIPMVPDGVVEWGKLATILCVIGIIYASCIAIVQKDFKRLIAYSSIAHVGLIAAGIFSFNEQSLQGAMIQMFSHGVNVVGLFFIVEIISSRTNTREISQLGGIRNVAPQFAVAYLIVLLGSVALPLTNGFVGEFLLINGLYQYNAWFAAFAGLTVILGAVYMLHSYQHIMLGETNKLTATFSEITTGEKLVLIPVIALIIGLGVYPKIVLDISEPAVSELINSLQLALSK